MLPIWGLLRAHRLPACSPLQIDGIVGTSGGPFAPSGDRANSPSPGTSRYPTLSSARLQPAVIALSGLLLFLVVVQSAWSIAMILQPRELLGSESIVYDKAARIFRGEPLYQSLDRPPYTVTAYTPLYYLLAGESMAIFGPGFGPGRAISFGAGIATALMVGRLTAQRARSGRAGVFATLLFLALGIPATPAWSALYREHVLGVALSFGVIAVLTGRLSTSRIVLAALLAALAVLTKQTLFASALAASVWLWQRDRRLAIQFLGIGSGVVVVTCGLLELSTHELLANTVYANVNPFSFIALKSNALIFLLFQGGAAAIAGLYLLERWRTRRLKGDELLAWYWLTSLLELVALAKVGAAMNYWIEFAAVSAVLATIGLRQRLTEPSASRALVPMVLLAVTIVPYTFLTANAALPRFWQLWPESEQVAALASLTERVRSEPRDVLADPLDVLVLAGRPLMFEPYIFSILHREGRWDASGLISSICHGGVGLVVMGQPLESDSAALHGYVFWATPILAALREAMVLETETAGRFIYVPRSTGPGVGSACAEASA